MLKLILSDFDGTLTDHTDLSSIFFDILDLLAKHNLELVIVTGRGTSWAYFLLTHIKSLNIVATEGGAVVVLRGENKNEFQKVFLVSEAEQKKLDLVSESLLKKFPGLTLSQDSMGRICDRAIELSYLESLEDKGASIIQFLQNEGVHFSKSNVHFNFWVGNPSKAQAIEYILKQKNIKKEEVIYFGDSFNDESAFAYLPLTVGVSNIENVLTFLKHKPRVILKGPDNRGPYGVFNYLVKVLG